MSRGYTPPPVTANLNIWAQNIVTYLQRTASRLAFKRGDARASEDGIILWDEVNGYPVVSKDGEWQPIILEDSPLDFGVKLSELEIENTYGDTVSVLAKKKTLLKFGKNEDLGTTQETVWNQGGEEVYVTTNAIDTVSSSDAGDSQSITIEGHTVSGTGASSQFTFVTQTATLNGQSKVVLTTPLARISRAYSNDATEFAGDVYIYEDTTISGGAPTTDAPIHLKILSGETQSFKAATTFSNTDYFICTGGFASVNKKTTAVVDFEMQVRRPGGVFRPVSRFSLASTGENTTQVQFYPYAIIPKNSDVRIAATSSASGAEVSASFSGFLASVQ